jgi:glutamate dehydrogenase (NAD(P)+)
MKGGLRYHPTVDAEDVTALASLGDVENRGSNIPYGGAKVELTVTRQNSPPVNLNV